MDSSERLDTIVQGLPLSPSDTKIFDPSDFGPGFEDKLVLKIHGYDIVYKPPSCPEFEQRL